MDDHKQYLLMAVGDSTYALSLEGVEEVLRMVALTPKPDAPGWLRGYLNLRGDILPALDLRVRLGAKAAPIGLDTVIVVAGTGPRRVGLIVDRVSDVVRLAFPNHGSTVTRYRDTPVFLLDPTTYIDEAHSV